MKILILSKHFWPENFRINLVVKNLSQSNQIDVLSEKPSYHKKFLKNRSEMKNISLIKFWTYPRSNNLISLFLNYLSFIILGTLKILSIRKKYDLIFVYATSPIFQAIPAIIYGKIFRVPTFLWVQDLWPDVLIDLIINRNSSVIYFVKLLTIYIYRNSDYIFAQSNSFKKNISKLSNKSVEVLYNPEIKHKSKFIYKKNKVTNLIFAGNIGKAQNLSVLIKACKEINNENILVKIFGNGSERNYLKKLIKKNNLDNKIKILNSISPKLLSKELIKSDGLLITLNKGRALSKTLPAKLQTYLSFGKPIISSADGELYEFIKKNNLGFSCYANDYKKLATIIKKIKNLSILERKIIFKNSKKIFNKHFELENWSIRLNKKLYKYYKLYKSRI